MGSHVKFIPRVSCVSAITFFLSLIAGAALHAFSNFEKKLDPTPTPEGSVKLKLERVPPLCPGEVPLAVPLHAKRQGEGGEGKGRGRGARVAVA